MLFSYFNPTKIIFNSNIITRLNEYVTAKKIMIVTDPALCSLGVADKIKSQLPGKEIIIFGEVEPNPSCDTADRASKLARQERTECVIGLGGGSSMDTAKAVAALLTNEGSIREYLYGQKQFVNNRKELVTIPTTSGTGSEVTNVAVFTDNVNHVKKPLVHRQLWADIAVVDPALTATLPKRVTASTGFDAFIHATEAYWATTSQPMTDAIALYSSRLILENLKKAYDTPDDIEARTNMALASTMAGVAFCQTRTTAIHAVSFPLTNLFRVDHGTACALTLVPFMKYAYPGNREKMDKFINNLGFDNISDLLCHITDLLKYMGMPVRLGQAGVSENDIPRIAQLGMSEGIFKLYPVPLTEKDLTRILLEIL